MIGWNKNKRATAAPHIVWGLGACNYCYRIVFILVVVVVKWGAQGSNSMTPSRLLHQVGRRTGSNLKKNKDSRGVGMYVAIDHRGQISIKLNNK